MMTRKNIITLPDVRLRQRSKKAPLNPETLKLAADMRAAILDWEKSRPHEVGVALAAVQVGRLDRVVIVRGDFEDKSNHDFVTLINPEIVKKEGQISLDHEGCLSVPDIYGLVPRFDKVRVKALDEEGREFRLKANGFLARVLQHEIDHANGIVFIDHIKDQDAFFKLTDEGELKKVSHETILQNSILWQ